MLKRIPLLFLDRNVNITIDSNYNGNTIMVVFKVHVQIKKMEFNG